jgi:hypothetical protein
MLFNLMAEHPNLVPTTGFPDGEDTEFWVRVAGAWIAGMGGVNSRTPVGHCFCLPMGGTDIDQVRVGFVHAQLWRRYRGLRRPGRRLLNKNPHLSNKLGFLHALFPDARVIHVIRHPYAMVASWKRLLAQYPHLLVEFPDHPNACLNIYPNNGWRPHMATACRQYPDFYDALNPTSTRLLARYWRNINTGLGRQLESLPQLACQMVHYEDLLGNQKGALNELLDFGKLPRRSEWTLQTRPHENEKWRAQLTPEECAIINDETAREAATFGYDLSLRTAGQIP